VFVDLRDRYGLTQVVFDRGVSETAFDDAGRLGNEWVVAVDGAVQARIEGQANDDMPTGQVEVVADALRILNPADTIPFEVARELNIDEVNRLKWRYLDLRRDRMRRNLELRHRVAARIRDYLNERDFLDVETPILTRATPEGARDFLVPSRVHPGRFYALPQSPQQLKQILMVAGVDRYYQIARCFRDEDLRADRQLEFTQLDLEMSFVDEEDVIGLTEALLLEIVREEAPKLSVQATPFPRMTYADAMARYGTDKPDLRFGLPLVDISDAVAESGFRVFSATVADGGRVKLIAVPAAFTRREIDELEAFAKANGAAGLAWIAFDAGEDGDAGAPRGTIAKFLGEAELAAIRAAADVDDLLSAHGAVTLLIVAAGESVANECLGRLRTRLGADLELIDPSVMAFCWIVDPPIVEWNADEARWDAVHHPFTAPRPEDVDRLDDAPGSVRARAYDIVANGYEIGGGSIRMHQADLQARVFALLGIDEVQAEAEFGHLLEAFRFGAPPHGGIAWGFDRLVMLLAGESTIREVIPFPKTLTAIDLLTDAPSQVPAASLAELGIAVVAQPKTPDDSTSPSPKNAQATPHAAGDTAEANASNLGQGVLP
ncbi:MAG TPA: aspartate--tRNA ligase, partial [Methylomirabilota bacterium]|nr:aspartate--tRNA ligase [Methylomirabilota bacterium]